jgi:hypothetical protein
MLPYGLHFQTFKSPTKLPMRLEQSSMEDFKKNLYKLANIECPKNTNEKKKNDEKKKKNKTKKKH